jgi:hypothetical protein
MNKTLVRLCAVVSAGLALYAPRAAAWGKKDQAAPGAAPAERGQETVRVEGRVRLVGNMPFPNTVISDSENNDWYVEGADKELVKDRQQETIVVEGVPEYQDLILANGEKIGVRRYLRNIRVIPQ